MSCRDFCCPLGGGAPPPVAVHAARLLEQLHALDLHPAIRRLDHVVDGEQGDRNGRQRLHLDSGPPHRPRRGPHPHPRQRLIQARLHLHVVQAHRMAQRDQLRRALRGQGGGDLAHRTRKPTTPPPPATRQGRPQPAATPLPPGPPGGPRPPPQPPPPPGRPPPPAAPDPAPAPAGRPASQ